ncbi:hypothetical protein JCM18909_3062 [Cutibacterium acnes JCM 18909]|nr:hypothetical protein JCM18909_3062 [Cutibacterium acnes JCM 18909]
MAAERNGIADADLKLLGSIFGQSDLVGLRRPGPSLTVDQRKGSAGTWWRSIITESCP